MTYAPTTLREWREQRGLSRRKAGEVLRVLPKTLEGLEYGRYPTSALWGPISVIVGMMEEKRNDTH